MCNLTARLSVMSLVKIDGSVMKNYLEMLGFSFCTKFDWGCYSFAVAKSTSNKIEALICSKVSFSEVST